VEPYVLYRYALHTPVRQYLKKYGIYALVVAGCWLLTDLSCRMASGSLVTVFFVRLFICLLLPNLCMLLVYGQTGEFRFVLGKVIRIWKKIREKKVGLRFG
jgi:hypothetical protein